MYDYIQVLYKQEKCLKELTNHYESAIASFQTVVKNAASRTDYENMLAYVQTEIGKLTRKKHQNAANGKKLQEEYDKNMPSSYAVFDKLEEKYGEEAVNDAIDQCFQTMRNVVTGKFTEEMITAFIKAYLF